MSKPNIDIVVSGAKQAECTYKNVVLKGNHSFASQVTEPNCIYTIKWDFDLGGEEVTIPENCVLKFDGGSINNGRIVINENTVIENGIFNSTYYPIISGIDSDNVTIKDCVFKGGITDKDDIVDESLDGSYGDHSAIKITGASNCKIHNIVATNIQTGVYVGWRQDGDQKIGGTNNTIRNVDFTGVLGTDMSVHGGSGSGGLNYHNAVNCQVAYSIIEGIKSRECGECVLLGNNSHNNLISHCIGRYQHDTFIYISTGYSNTVIGCDLDTGCGTGIKLRGSYNKAIGNTLRNMEYGNFAISVTGNAFESIETEYGIVNGVYNEVVGNILDRISGGINISSIVSGGNAYNVYGTLVSDNIISNSIDLNPDLQGIRDFAYRTRITNNVIQHTNIAIILGSLTKANPDDIEYIPGVISKGCVISDNRISTQNNYPIKAQCVENGVICRNVFASTLDCIDRILYVKNTVFTDNLVLNTEKKLFSNRVPSGTGEWTSMGNYYDYGSSGDTPTIIYRNGMPFYNSDLKKEIWYDKTDGKWLEADGSVAGVTRRGNNTTIPQKGDVPLGFMYLNTAMNYIPIYNSGYSGNDILWKNALGFTAAKVRGNNTGLPKGKHIVGYKDSEGNVSPTQDETHTIPVYEGELLESNDIGFPYYSTAYGYYIFAKTIDNNTGNVTWVEYDGITAGARRSGTKSQRPGASNNIYVGFKYMQVDEVHGTFPIWVSAINGTTVTWVKADGTSTNTPLSGTFANKPTVADNIYAGFRYFCTSGASIDGGTTEKTNIPIFFDGTNKWYDANGNEVVAKS